jgi:hypothetical protein
MNGRSGETCRSVSPTQYSTTMLLSTSADTRSELVHARQILNVQLASPHNTSANYNLAWDFWWRVATRHERARNAHVFTYHGVRRADGENAEGIPELVQNIPLRIREMEQRAAARTMVSTNPYASQPTPPPSPAQQSSAVQDGARPTMSSAGGRRARFMVPSYQPSTPSNLNPQKQQQVQQQTYLSHPPPEQYPATTHHRATDNLGSQPHRPPFTRPRHTVFWYFNRDLSGNAVLPRLPDGRDLFVRSTTNMTDQGWGPGVAVHQDFRGQLATIDGVHTTGLIGRDKGRQAG